MVTIRQFDVVLVSLDPTLGSEIKKTRPCLIISPDSMNISKLKTVIAAPMTTTIRENFPTRINLDFAGKQGQIALDQLRVIDRLRIVKSLGKITDKALQNKVLNLLQTMFS
ncbi:MAG: hypothetical protein K0R66_1619 [Gammaproteobacteria bacterium]|jgi:mRNA interferase MazF|nr:hypothetical protein [Gammaproteobacteria bacterium]